MEWILRKGDTLPMWLNKTYRSNQAALRRMGGDRHRRRECRFGMDNGEATRLEVLSKRNGMI